MRPSPHLWERTEELAEAYTVTDSVGCREADAAAHLEATRTLRDLLTELLLEDLDALEAHR